METIPLGANGPTSLDNMDKKLQSKLIWKRLLKFLAPTEEEKEVIKRDIVFNSKLSDREKKHKLLSKIWTVPNVSVKEKEHILSMLQNISKPKQSKVVSDLKPSLKKTKDHKAEKRLPLKSILKKGSTNLSQASKRLRCDHRIADNEDDKNNIKSTIENNILESSNIENLQTLESVQSLIKDYVRDDLDLHMTRISGTHGIHLAQKTMLSLQKDLKVSFDLVTKFINELKDTPDKYIYLLYVSHMQNQIADMKAYNKLTMDKINECVSMREQLQQLHEMLMEFRDKAEDILNALELLRELIKKQVFDEHVKPSIKANEILTQLERKLLKQIHILKLNIKSRLVLNPQELEVLRCKTKALRMGKMRSLIWKWNRMELENNIRLKNLKDTFSNEIDELNEEITDQNRYIQELQNAL